MRTPRLTIVVMLFALNIGASPAAQELPGMIAYDYCQLYDWDWGIECGVYLANGTYLGEGTDPAWSADGSRIAFTGYSQPGIFVLNLADWSVVSLPGFGGELALSPDGLKLAFSAGELYVMGADGSDVVQLTQSIGFIGQPAWSPDGQAIAFDCEIDAGNGDICTVQADGTGLVRLTTDPAWDSGPAYSPEGSRIAFARALPFANSRIVVMNADGTGTTEAGPVGSQPAWSPDGTRIVFVVPFEGACEADGRICPDTIYISNVDGTDPRAFASGNRPAWGLSAQPVASFVLWPGCNGLVCDFDGTGSWGGDGGILSYAWNFGDGTTTDSGPAVSHAYSASGTYTVTLTVTDAKGVTGIQTASVNVVENKWPTASFTYACTGSQCTFDGSASSDSDGLIAGHYWFFGDGGYGGSSGSPTVSHTYTAVGAFNVRLLVIDNGGAWNDQWQTVTITAVTINAPPVASFTSSCTDLTCSFNAGGSSDSDGTIASYAWSFGDGTAGAGATPIRTYAAGGSYTVMLTVTDNGGATSTYAHSVTAVPPAMHVGDLGGGSTRQQSRWTATVTITIHDNTHAPVVNALVNGLWNDGVTGSCTTTSGGRCAVSRSGIHRPTTSVSFTVTNVARAPFMYAPTSNHDADGGSNGTTISIARQ